jgi:tetratricopeptide (TPR) repeat protein/transcriptional regulator with XRE-family HTH domain
MQVSQQLVQLRHDRRMTLAALSTRLTELGRPISVSGLSKIEQGTRRTDADDLVALARAFDVPLEQLLSGRQTAHQPVEIADRPLGPPGEMRLDAPLVQLPRPPVRVFVGRDELLRRLDVHHGGAVVIQAVHGLGGVGKSELALHYCHAHRDDYPILWWINAESPDRVEAGLAELTATVAARTGRTAPALSADAAAWAIGLLAGHPGWLLVLDNVEDPADVASLLGRLSGGRVLITSRRDFGWLDLVDASLSLDVLQPAAAAELLMVRSGQDDRETAAELAAELGCLPLALGQAAAYIKRTRTPMLDYLARLRERPGPLLSAEPPGGIGTTVGRLWDLTLSTISASQPLAIDLVRVLACLAPDDVPRALLSGLDDDPAAVDMAAGLLASYSMITLDETTVSVHRLVQAVAAERALSAGTISADLRRALHLVRRAQPETGPEQETVWSWWRAMIPHMQALISRWPPEDPDPDLGRLLIDAGVFLRSQGAYQAAIALDQRAWDITRITLGADHPDTLTSRDHLALGLRAVARYQEAVELWEKTLADRTRVLGPNHPDTLTSQAHLAAGYRALADYAKAVGLWEKTLADRTRVLGADHPDTLQSLTNLAFGYREVGRVEEAVPLDERTLAMRTQLLGPEHPRTLNSRHNLANDYRAVGRYAEAIALHEQTLADRTRKLGPDHPHTIATRSALAADYRAVGRYDEAIRLDEQTVADRVALLGPLHPNTLASRNDLALGYSAVGRHDEAIALWKGTAAEMARVLGSDHPATLAARTNLDRERGA